ncbi:arginine vasopressin-induced 1, isoform CRA_a [Rattus norvegicus]|uniref:Arginine vasopressin-induced 1, isoform CRA_a n=1 Tax=Rattus norvegicus TaxID=10116 RepID=A6JHA7_RAT|nr:arginine vasopressin-induced 1, isoform CRA_a [Rattus norvegicus]
MQHLAVSATDNYCHHPAVFQSCATGQCRGETCLSGK